MKIARSNKDFGGGLGRELFQSELFRVVVWNMSEGTRTTINLELDWRVGINFEGRHELITDELCMEQLECSEIVSMIKKKGEISFKEGEKSKINEIKNCLNID